MLRAAFAANNGREVDTQGDSFLVAFERATEALKAAVEAQRALAAHPWPEDTAVRVRMGLHTGEPARTAEGYVGLDVVRGARIGAAGHGGQILLSLATADLVRPTLPDGMGLLDLGEHRLKGLRRPEQIFQLLLAERSPAFPPLKTLEGGVPVAAEELHSLGTLTILFTDLVGFTKQVLRLGDRAGQRWIRIHNRILRACFQRFEGIEQHRSGDGFLVTFDSALRAVDCAVAIQRELRTYNQAQPDAAIQVRISLHIGEVFQGDEGPRGNALRMAARVLSKAKGGQILASELLYRLARPASEAEFVQRGTFTLADIGRPQRLYEVRWDQEQ